MSTLRIIIVVTLLTFLVPGPGRAAPVVPARTDKCPVCGMFVAKYPDFLTQIIFKDGSYALFDGVKDMFKYYFAVQKYNGAKSPADISAVYVTDYYSMTPVDGQSSWYVAGSDVFGPMGRELIPFAKKTDALEFMKDHAGKELLPFAAITPEHIKGLD